MPLPTTPTRIDGDSLHIVAVDGQSILPGGTVVLGSGAKVALQLDGRIAYDPTGAFTHLAFQEHAPETFRYSSPIGPAQPPRRPSA